MKAAATSERPHKRMSIWSIAGPSILVFLISTIASLLIIKIVSGLGTPAVAAVTAGQRIHFIQLALLMGMGSATTALVSRAWGGQSPALATAYTKLSLKVGLLVCGSLSVMAALLAGPIADFFQLSGETHELAVSYIRWLYLFAPAQGLVMMMSTACRAVGDAKTPLYIGIISNGVSVFGAYALAYGVWGLPAMGVEGAAIGWGIAYMIAALVYMLAWWRDSLLLPFRQPAHAAVTNFKRFVAICMPATVEQLIMQGAMILFIGFVAGYGTEAFAAYGVGMNLLAVAMVIGLGFSIAASASVGQSLGAKDPQAAVESSNHALKLACITLTATGIGSALFATPISEFMVEDEKVAQITAQFLLALALLQPLMAIDFVLGGAMRGAGDTRFPLIAGLVTILGVRVPLAALCTWLELPVWCVFSVFIADQLVKSVMIIVRYRRKRWMKVLNN